MPFNMYTFNKMWGLVTPEEAAAKIAVQDETYYPVNDAKNGALYSWYKEMAASEKTSSSGDAWGSISTTTWIRSSPRRWRCTGGSLAKASLHTTYHVKERNVLKTERCGATCTTDGM